jgi:hypothetical protein
MTRQRLLSSVLLASLLTGACVQGISAPTAVVIVTSADAPAVVSIRPSASTTGVDPSLPITITFSMSMMPGAEMLVVVHEGSVTGPQVAGTSAWSADRKVMTFTPAAMLKAKTTYVVHIAPSITAANGKAVDPASCTSIGGHVVTGGMMGSAQSGMMNGSWGPGMMGAGWKAGDGTFGMMFTFTTA